MGPESSYKNNTKKTEEGKTVPLTLPLNIDEGELIERGGDSLIWKIKNGENVDVLKISDNESFATEEEMQKAEDFYKFLKNFPGFGKFVPDTIYFIAKETEEDAPRAFCVQQFKKGERIDRLKDDDIYKDKEVVKQLLELTDVSIKVIQTVRKNDGQYPDFMRTPELKNVRAILGATIFNPRYSSNIMITDEPNKSGQRVWFVDAGINANARKKKGWEWKGRHRVGSVMEIQFKVWKKKLETILQKMQNKSPDS